MRIHTALSWINLFHRKSRALVAVAGVCFAVTLIFMQLGFYAAVLKTAGSIHQGLNADIFLMSPAYSSISRPGSFPRGRVYQAAGMAGVETVVPLYAGIRLYENPVNGTRRQMLVLGFNPAEHAFALPEVAGNLHELKFPDTFLMDRRTRPEFGPQDRGLTTEIEGRKVLLAGQYSLGVGFAALGDMITADKTFVRLFRDRTLDDVSLGLVQLKPGANASAVAEQLRRLLPNDVRVLTREEMLGFEADYWSRTTSIGLIFGFGVVVAFAVGVLILYQILAADITRGLSEYATLKAIGYHDRQIASVVVLGGLWISVASYFPAFILALIINKLTRDAANLPAEMTVTRAAAVFVMAVAISAGSGWLALGKLRAANPADLFSVQR
jgi:putative ABC transport system permease protein